MPAFPTTAGLYDAAAFRAGQPKREYDDPQRENEVDDTCGFRKVI